MFNPWCEVSNFWSAIVGSKYRSAECEYEEQHGDYYDFFIFKILLIIINVVEQNIRACLCFECNDARNNAKAEYHAEKITLLKINFFENLYPAGHLADYNLRNETSKKYCRILLDLVRC